MSECSSSIDSVKRVKLILNDDEELEDPGLTVSTADKQTSTGRVGPIAQGLNRQLLAIRGKNKKLNVEQELNIRPVY